jgi:hypothetical protein
MIHTETYAGLFPHLLAQVIRVIHHARIDRLDFENGHWFGGGHFIIILLSGRAERGIF